MNNENIIIKERNGIKYLQFKRLLEYKDKITHAFYIGKDLNFRTFDHNGAHPENFINYKIFLDVLDLDYRKCIKANQNHSSKVKIINKKVLDDAPDLNLKEYDDIDALITNKKSLVLGTTAADCILILIYDPKLNIIANVHSGWKGTLGNIIGVTLKQMVREYNVNPKDVICAICPSIRKCCFEVGEDVYSSFKDKYLKDTYYQNRNGKWFIDLIEIVKNCLLEEGVLLDNIIDSNICSKCYCEEIHSYRADKEKFSLGLAVISLKEDK